MKKIITKSEQETFDLAKKYARKLKGGEVVGLQGDLGAGKTIFAKGLACGLGVKKTVTSPTFAVMKIYPAQKFRIKKFVHIDAYRLASGKDLESIGALEFFGLENCVVLIEWPQIAKKILPPNAEFVKIEIEDNNKRVFKF